LCSGQVDIAGDHVCISSGEASRKYLKPIWELDKILSQRPKTLGHVWSLGSLLGALENKK
jgi:hypothetical protein